MIVTALTRLYTIGEYMYVSGMINGHMQLLYVFTLSELPTRYIILKLTGSFVSSEEASSMRSLARGSPRLCMCSLHTVSSRLSSTIR